VAYLGFEKKLFWSQVGVQHNLIEKIALSANGTRRRKFLRRPHLFCSSNFHRLFRHRQVPESGSGELPKPLAIKRPIVKILPPVR